MITLPPQITDTFVPLNAGLMISLMNKYILNNHKLNSCCKSAESEDADSESDSNETTKTELCDTLSKASSATTATLPSAHPTHTPHHIYYYTHH